MHREVERKWAIHVLLSLSRVEVEAQERLMSLFSCGITDTLSSSMSISLALGLKPAGGIRRRRARALLAGSREAKRMEVNSAGE
jgi:hypothetical protein